MVFSASKRFSNKTYRSSIELIPIWKVYGFTQISGRAAQETSELQTINKDMLNVHTNQVPFEWPSNQKTNDETNKQEQQISWENRLMHRSKSM